MTPSDNAAHSPGFSYPAISAPVMDRCIARLRNIPVLEQIVHSTGLRPCLQNTFPPEQCDRVLQKISSDRMLQMFSEDARNGSQLLFSLLLNRPVLLERILCRLNRHQQQWILQLFGECPPTVSEEIATHYALLLTRLKGSRIAVPVLTTLLRNSDTAVKAAALQGLFEGDALTFGLLINLVQKFTPRNEDSPTIGQAIIDITLEQAQRQRNVKLINHLHIYIALIYRSLPRYQQYWSQCTELPLASCPVIEESVALQANLNQLTQTLVHQLYRAKDEDSLLSLTARRGWRSIQARSRATLRNAEPAIGDFIFRTFLSLLPGTLACQTGVIIEAEEETQLQLSSH